MRLTFSEWYHRSLPMVPSVPMVLVLVNGTIGNIIGTNGTISKDHWYTNGTTGIIMVPLVPTVPLVKTISIPMVPLVMPLVTLVQLVKTFGSIGRTVERTHYKAASTK